MYDDIDLKAAQNRSYWVGFFSGAFTVVLIFAGLIWIGLKYNI